MTAFCYYINPAQDPDEHGGYVPSMVRRGESGHFPMLGRGAYATPWIWGKTLAEAENVCEQQNIKLGLNPNQVNEIIASSMRQTLA